jgi:hypothetical protein
LRQQRQRAFLIGDQYASCLSHRSSPAKAGVPPEMLHMFHSLFHL